MDKLSLKGKVQTVLGLVEPEELGFTITHEHLLSDMSCLLPKTLRLVFGKMRRNLIKIDVTDAIHEVELYKKAGGNTMVDVTPIHLRTNLKGLPRISRDTGIHVIAGTAYYTDPTLPKEMKKMTIEDLALQYIHHITEGIESTEIRAGIIGELGCSWPITLNEEKSLKAAAIAQRETGAPISIHSGYHPEAPFEILNILTEAGAKPEQIILGHMEYAFSPEDRESRLKFAQTGCYMQFDSFGAPDSQFILAHCKSTSDEDRIDQIKELIAHGHLNQILISHDMYTNEAMTYGGGPGYSHIPKNILPLMSEKGISEEEVHAITMDNPARALSFK